MEINLLCEAAQDSRCRRNAQRTRILCRNPVVLAFVNAISPDILLAATALTILPRLSQDCISASIVQVGAIGATEQQAEPLLAGRDRHHATFMRERVLPALMRENAEILINRSHISSGTV